MLLGLLYLVLLFYIHGLHSKKWSTIKKHNKLVPTTALEDNYCKRATALNIILLFAKLQSKEDDLLSTLNSSKWTQGKLSINLLHSKKNKQNSSCVLARGRLIKSSQDHSNNRHRLWLFLSRGRRCSRRRLRFALNGVFLSTLYNDRKAEELELLDTQRNSVGERDMRVFTIAIWSLRYKHTCLMTRYQATPIPAQLTIQIVINRRNELKVTTISGPRQRPSTVTHYYHFPLNCAISA